MSQKWRRRCKSNPVHHVVSWYIRSSDISLPLKVSSFAPPLLDIQTAAAPITETLKPEVSSALVISQSNISSLYVPLPNQLASQKKSTTLPLTETANPSFASQKENVSPREHHLSEQRKSNVSPSFVAQSAPQPAHTPLEHGLLQTVQQLTHSSSRCNKHGIQNQWQTWLHG